jgi:hypothetical protein
MAIENLAIWFERPARSILISRKAGQCGSGRNRSHQQRPARKRQPPGEVNFAQRRWLYPLTGGVGVARLEFAIPTMYQEFTTRSRNLRPSGTVIYRLRKNRGNTVMPEINPLAVIAECIEKAKATTDPELISDYITEALGVLQIDNNEDDAFHMLGSAIVDAVADDEEHSASLFEVWTELEEQAEAVVTDYRWGVNDRRHPRHNLDIFDFTLTCDETATLLALGGSR